MESKNDKTELCLTRRETLQGMAGLVAVSLVGGSTAAAELDLPPVSDRDLKFNSGWRFYRGEAPGAEAPTFDDAAWRALDIPHDWSIEDLPRRTGRRRGSYLDRRRRPGARGAIRSLCQRRPDRDRVDRRRHRLVSQDLSDSRAYPRAVKRSSASKAST